MKGLMAFPPLPVCPLVIRLNPVFAGQIAIQFLTQVIETFSQLLFVEPLAKLR